jgi:toxin-antitoxin system PIN domain toxin
MILLDVNVLIYAFRTDAAEHPRVRPWFERVMRSEAVFAVSRLALSAVVRVTTNARIYRSPSKLDEAFGFCEDITDQPHCIVIEPGERHWTIFQRLCRETETTGPRVTDAWFAALAIEHGCEWVTLDRDFACFPELKWRAPD